MAGLRVEIDITGYVEEVDEARSKDIPFATAKALTRTAQDAQIEVKRDIGRLFTLRNSWTQQNIKITPAQKLSWPIEAEVYTDTGNASAPDYLVAQEDAALKVPHDGHLHVAIPTQILRSLIGKGTVIPAALRPNELLAAFTGTHVSRRSKADVRTPKSQQYEGFKAYSRGNLYIFVRRPNEKRGEILPFYLLVEETKVRAVLGMQETVERVAAERFEQHWDDAWAEIGGS
jgi:hypothetical protein